MAVAPASNREQATTISLRRSTVPLPLWQPLGVGADPGKGFVSKQSKAASPNMPSRNVGFNS